MDADPEPKSQQQQQKHWTSGYVACLRLIYKYDRMEACSAGFAPPVMTTGIQIYSRSLYLGTASHLAPQSVSHIEDTRREK